MKILHIDSEMTWGGGQNQTRLLIKEMLKSGIECHLVCPEGSVLAKRYLDGETPAPKLKQLSGWRLGRMIAIRNYCREHGITILHCHSGAAHTLAFWTKFIFGLKQKLVVHRRVPIIPSGNPLTRLKYTSSLVDHFISVSVFISKVLVSYGVPANKSSAVLSVAEPESYDLVERTYARRMLCEKIAASSEATIVGVAARLEPEKGIHDLIEAARILLQSGRVTNLQLVIAGIGPEKERLERLRDGSGFARNIHILGFIKKTAEILKALDIFVLPSHEEGLGSVLTEAGMCSLPCVGGNVDGIPEIIKHEQTGFLIEPGRVDQIADAIERLAKDQELRKKLGDALRKQVFEKNTPAAMLSGVLEVYKKI